MTFHDTDLKQSGQAQILLIEDDPLICDVLTGFLENWGYGVQSAGDSHIALQTAPKLHRLELIVTDIDLPGELNGVEVVAAIGEQRQGSTPSAIFMSGHSPAELQSFGLNGDRINFLEKPFRADAFHAAVSHALARPDDAVTA